VDKNLQKVTDHTNPPYLAILIEGLETSGKSKVGKRLIHDFPQLKLKGGGLINNFYHEQAKMMSNKEEAAQILWDGVLFDAANAHIPHNTLHISWALKTAAVIEVLHQQSVDINPIRDVVSKFSHSIGLLVDVSVQKERLIRRKEEHPEKFSMFDLYVLTERRFTESLHACFYTLLQRANFAIIDTSHQSKEETYQAVRDMIMNHPK